MKVQTLYLFFLITLMTTSTNCFLQQEEQNVTAEYPEFSLESGFYDVDQVEELEIKSDFTIYYTLDSTDPTTSETANIYSKPIKLYDKSPEDNMYSIYQTEENSPYSIKVAGGKYRVNKNPFDKMTVVRAVAQNDQGEFGPIVNKVYMVMNQEKLEFYKKIPVVSIVTSPENLFDKDIGIYVCGQQYIDWLSSPEYDPNLSFEKCPMNFVGTGKEWEREAEITLFEKEGKLGFSEKMGIRIKGSATRQFPFKSFNVYAKKKYNGHGKLKYKLLEQNINYLDGSLIEKYDSFGLRSISVPSTHYKELFVSEPLKDIEDLASYEGRRCVLFIDGELWGAYEIMEKSSGYYFETNYGLPEENISMMKNYEIENGQDADFADFKKYHKQMYQINFKDPEVYKEISSVIDVESFAYHYAVGIYVGIWDWPNYNFFIWKYKGEPIEGNPYSDGKYRFGSFDFDWSCGSRPYADPNHPDYSFNYWPHFDEKRSSTYPTTIFASLLQNEEFKQLFAEKMKYLAEEVFAPEKMNKIMDDVENNQIDYLVLNEWRWVDHSDSLNYETFFESTKTQLMTELEGLREFFNKRGQYAVDQTQNYLSSH